MAPWLRVLELYLVEALLRTPAFHRGVEKVVKTVHRIRHGVPPEELGGTKIDQPAQSAFSKHFLDEVKTQLGYAEQQEAKSAARSTGMKDHSVDARGQKSNVVKEEEINADAAWSSAQKNAHQPPKAGFMQEYMDALREQVNRKSGK